ncbi:MAG: hypothetical protein KKD77_23395 [Gammaproteobacteria bacterium]|nr:hypothetical protein [Gammaproteobacteria bacterium]
MNRKVFLKKAVLLGAAAVTAFDGELRYHLPAANRFFTGSFVAMVDGKAVYPKTWHEKIIGIAIRNIEQDEVIMYDPLGNTGDIATSNTVSKIKLQLPYPD